MATVKFILRRDKINSKKEGPIYAQYTHQERSVLIATGKRLEPRHWDFKQGKAKIHENAGTLNSFFGKFAGKIHKIATELEENDVNPSPAEVKFKFEENKRKNLPEADLVRSILYLWNEQLKGRKSGIAPRTYQSESASLTALKEFLTSEKLEHVLPEKFSLKNVHKWQSQMNESKANNTVAKRLKHFKAFLKYYQKLGGKLGFDISDMKFKERPGPKVSLTQEELKQLQEHPLTGRKAEIRDLYVLQCHCGLRISDLKRVDKNIEGNKIKLTAQKTGVEITIPISPTIRQILERYNYRLPQVPDQKVNEHIKKILADACPESTMQIKEGKGFKTIYKHEVISSHDSIRTFISISAERGMSVPSIAKITGKSIQVLLKHYLNNSQKAAEQEFEKAWGVSPLRIAK